MIWFGIAFTAIIFFGLGYVSGFERFARLTIRRLESIQTAIQDINQKEVFVAGELDKLESDVAAEETVIGGVETLLSSLKSELDAAIAANDMSRVAAVSAKIEADTASLSAAVVQNTPSAPATAQ